MSDRAEREKQLDWLYRLKSNLKIFIPKDFHLAEFEQSLDYAISSIKTDLKYDLLYEETTHTADADKKIEPTTKNDLGVDCISRQSVLDIIRLEDKWLLDAKGHNADTEIAFIGMKSRIADLPSVTPQEPQTFKWCDTCKEYDQEKHCCHRYSEVIRDTVAEIRQEPTLDKLRAEIDKIYEREGNSVDCLNALDELKWFIDKYKAESEN